jgi:hypothetical protein
LPGSTVLFTFRPGRLPKYSYKYSRYACNSVCSNKVTLIFFFNLDSHFNILVYPAQDFVNQSKKYHDQNDLNLMVGCAALSLLLLYDGAGFRTTLPYGFQVFKYDYGELINDK